MRLTTLVLIPTILALAGGAPSAAGPTVTAAPSARVLHWVPNGPVAGVVSVGKRLLIGGRFSRLSPRTGPLVALSRQTAKPVSGLPEFAGGPVDVVVADGNGGWFVGGDFRWAGGLARSGLAHVLADGRVDHVFNPAPAYVTGPYRYPGKVFALALSGRTLFVGGGFSRIGGRQRAGLAALDARSGAATAWDPHSNNAAIQALVIDGSTLFVAGRFTQIGGETRSGLAALSSSTGRATPWDPAPDGSVSALAIADGLVYLGGDFSRLAGASRLHLGAVDEQKGIATDWSPSVPATVTALAAGDGSLFAGLRARAGAPSSILMAFGRSDPTQRWSVKGDGAIATLALDGKTLYAGGAFRTIATAHRDGVAAFATTGLLLKWNAKVDLFVADTGEMSAVHALGAGRSRIIVGGDFAGVGGVARDGLAVIDPAGGAPTAWTARLDGYVSGLAGGGNRVYIVGAFNHVGRKYRGGAAAFGPDLRLLPWSPLPVDGIANDVTVIADKVVLTGFFNDVARTGRHGSLAAFDGRSGRFLDWGPPDLVGNGVGQVLAGGGRIYAVGVSGGSSAVAELRQRTGRVKRYLFDNRGTGDVYAIALRGRTLYVGGAVRAIDGTARLRLAAVDAVTGRLLSWRQDADENVFSMALDGNVLFVGGQFQRVGGRTRVGLAALDARTGRLLPWNARLSGFVSRVGRFQGGTYAVGRFFSVGPHANPYLALFR